MCLSRRCESHRNKTKLERSKGNEEQQRQQKQRKNGMNIKTFFAMFHRFVYSFGFSFIFLRIFFFCPRVAHLQQ